MSPSADGRTVREALSGHSLRVRSASPGCAAPGYEVEQRAAVVAALDPEQACEHCDERNMSTVRRHVLQQASQMWAACMAQQK